MVSCQCPVEGIVGTTVPLFRDRIQSLLGLPPLLWRRQVKLRNGSFLCPPPWSLPWRLCFPGYVRSPPGWTGGFPRVKVFGRIYQSRFVPTSRGYIILSGSRALEFLASRGITALGNLVLSRRDSLLADVRSTVPVEEVASLRYSPLPEMMSLFPSPQRGELYRHRVKRSEDRKRRPSSSLMERREKHYAKKPTKPQHPARYEPKGRRGRSRRRQRTPSKSGRGRRTRGENAKKLRAPLEKVRERERGENKRE